MGKQAKEHSLIAYNATIQIIGRIFFLVLSFVNIKLITSYLTPNKFGEYATILTFTGFFTVLIDLGFFTVAIREIAKAKERAEEIMANVLSLRIITAVAATGIAIGFGYAIPKYASLGNGILIAAAAMFVYFLSNVLDVIFHVNLKMQFIALAENVSKLSTLVIVYLAIKLDLGLNGIIGAILFGNLAAIAPRLYFASRMTKLKLAFDFKVWRWLLRLALPFGIVFILNNIYFKIDSQMLYLLSSTYDAGLYGLAYRIMEATLFVAAFITAAITPTLSRTIETDKKAAGFLVSRTLEILLAAALLLLVTVSIFARPIVLILSDAAYLQAVSVLPLLAGAAALIYLNSLFGQILIAADRRKILIAASLVLVLFNIGLNLILIPRFGFIGAGIATLISEIGILIFNLLVTLKILPLRLNLKTILIIILATAAAAIFFYFFRDVASWIGALILGLAFYSLIIWQFKLFDLQMIKRVVRGS